MHGRKRANREENDPPEIKQAKLEKYKQYLAGCRLALSSEQAAAKAEKILRYNPDFLTLWNARRRAILSELGNQDDVVENAIDKRRVILSNELALTKEQIAERNSKSYGAWFHRRWAIEELGFYQGTTIVDLQAELELCDMFLLRDERNFHCWAHRNLIARFAGVTQQQDLEKSFKLIEKNFSNYSAWHLRVQAISALGDTFQDFAAEFELIHQAIFTEPADQSAWLYFRWLLIRSKASQDRLREEIDVIGMLLADEGDCKWPLLAMLQLHASLQPWSEDIKSVALDLCERIRVIDPDHAQFYQYLEQLFQSDDARNHTKLNKVLFCNTNNSGFT